MQTRTGTLVVDLSAASSKADHLQVNGKATLDGSVVPVVADLAHLHSGPGTQLTILTATGGVTLSGVGAVGSPVFQANVSAIDANDLALNYNVDFGATAALRAGGLLSPNRQEIGRALNAILANDAPSIAALTARLVTATSAQEVATTLDAVTGEVVADVQQVAFTAQDVFTSTIVHHIIGEDRSGSGPLAYGTAALDPVGPPADAAGVRVWVAGSAANDALSGTNGLGSLHSQIAGAQLGVDKWIDDAHMVGVSVGGGSIDFNVADRASEGTSRSLNAAAYGLARFGDAYVSGIISYGNYDTDLKRTGLGAALGVPAVESGSLTDNIIGGRIEAGWRQQLGTVAVTPFAAVEVVHLWQAGFTETVTGDPSAAGLALQFGHTAQTTVPLSLGARAGSSFQVGGGHVLDMTAELAWVHNFNPDRSLTGAFVAAPDVPFTVQGLSASANAAQVGLGAKLSLTSNVALRGYFTGRFSGVETAYGGFGGLQVTW